MKPRAYSYLRFSTARQAQGENKARQLDAARAYASANRLELDEELTFQDLGVSAYRSRNLKVGRLGDFIGAVEQGLVTPGSYLLVENLDRVSRDSARKAIRVLEHICDLGVRLVTLSDGRLYTKEILDRDSTSFLISIISFIRANEESQVRSERQRAAWQRRFDRAPERKVLTHTLSWLRYDKDSGEFVVIPEKVEAIRWIFKKAADHWTFYKITFELNRRNVPLLRNGKRWHVSSVSRLIKNPAVIGTYVPYRTKTAAVRKRAKHRAPIENYYPPIIPEALFNRVQAIIATRRSTPWNAYIHEPRKPGGPVGYDVQHNTNVFGYIGECPLCGDRMKLNSNRTEYGGNYLECAAARSGKDCSTLRVRYDAAEAALVENLDAIIATAPKSEITLKLKQRLVTTRDNREDYEARLRRLVELAEQQDDVGLIAERMAEITEKIQLLNSAEDAILAQMAGLDDAVAEKWLDQLKEAIQNNRAVCDPFDRQRANRILRQLMSAVVIDYPKDRLVFRWQYGGETEATLRDWRLLKYSRSKRATLPPVSDQM